MWHLKCNTAHLPEEGDKHHTIVIVTPATWCCMMFQTVWMNESASVFLSLDSAGVQWSSSELHPISQRLLTQQWPCKVTAIIDQKESFCAWDHLCETSLLSVSGINVQLWSAYPEYPVEVFLVHTKEVAVVLSQNDGGSTRWICNQGQLPKVITLVERTHYPLRHTYAWLHT